MTRIAQRVDAAAIVQIEDAELPVIVRDDIPEPFARPAARSKTRSGIGHALVPETYSGARLHPYQTNSRSRPAPPSAGCSGAMRNESRYGVRPR